ncbi:MAG: GNAT family N-acetyltransferase [Clostridia bacterium]|nr:GNAT family N-acetyltransferase [Clostridia bacterium]
MSINFRPSTPKDELSLKRLFLNCFDDTLGFVNMFFEHHFVCENTLLAEEDDRMVGMAFLLPCEVENAPCFYIYGVCVASDRRGEGIGTRLLNYAVNVAENRGARVLLLPENESLFPFYEKAGFSPCAYYKKVVFEGCDTAEAAELFEVSSEEYKALRDKGFEGRRPVIWDRSSIEYALLHETFFGGRAFKYKVGEEEGVLLCVRDGGESFIKETSASDRALPLVAAAAQKAFGGDKITALLPGDRFDRPYAYGIGFTQPVYLNLMLD